MCIRDRHSTPGAEGLDRCVSSVWADNRRLYEKSVGRSLARRKVLHGARIHRVCLIRYPDLGIVGLRGMNTYLGMPPTKACHVSGGHAIMLSQQYMRDRPYIRRGRMHAGHNSFCAGTRWKKNRIDRCETQDPDRTATSGSRSAISARQKPGDPTSDALKHVSHGHSCIRMYGHRQRMFLYR